MTDLVTAAPSHLVDVDGVRIACSVWGDGPPVLLLHGYPQSRVMWHAVAPELARHFTVVVADLRGYGDSDKPLAGDYSKRAMAADQLAVMDHLGFERFAVVGHDRGGRVAHRLALDAPDRVTRAAVLDIVPTLHMFDNVDRAMASSYFHWFFLTQPAGMPEALIGADPQRWLRSRFDGRWAVRDPLTPATFARYLEAFDDPAAIAASCADYRAAATVDLDHDRADRLLGRRVTVPLLALWGESSYVGRNFDVAEVWRDYAHTVYGRALPGDHYIAEESPGSTAQELLAHLLDEGDSHVPA